MGRTVLSEAAGAGGRDLGGESPAPAAHPPLSELAACRCPSQTSPWLQPSGSAQSGDGSSGTAALCGETESGRWAAQAHHFQVLASSTQGGC